MSVVWLRSVTAGPSVRRFTVTLIGFGVTSGPTLLWLSLTRIREAKSRGPAASRQ